MRNEDRQKRLVEDTQKLLTLANQLKEEVGKSSKDTMSITVIKKAATTRKPQNFCPWVLDDLTDKKN